MTKIDQTRLGFEPIETSLWSTSAIPMAGYASVMGSLTADVVVIGGGYTGLSTALHAAEAGQSVILLEAEQPGSAASGRNAAQVCPLLQVSPEQVIQQLGAELGGRVNRLIATSGALVFDLIERLRIDCKPRRNGQTLVCRTGKSLDAMISAARQFEAFGAPVAVLGKDELADYVVSDRYAGGVRYLDGGLIQPLSYARGLAGAADRAGAEIFGNSAVLSTARRNGRWLVQTAHGEVSARVVIFGAGGYLQGNAWPALREVGYTVVAACMSSSPLPDGGKSILPRGGPMVDLDDHAVFSPAIDPEGRLTMTVMVQGGVPSIGALAPIANRRLKKAFPQLEEVGWERFSLGRMTVTPDHLPRIVRLAPDMYAGVGCQGLGITYATGTGRELARLSAGVSESDIDLPVTDPVRAPMARVMPSILRHVIFPILNRLTA